MSKFANLVIYFYSEKTPQKEIYLKLNKTHTAPSRPRPFFNLAN